MSRRKLPEPVMPATTKKLRCAVYTRKSTDEGLEKEFIEPAAVLLKLSCIAELRMAEKGANALWPFG